MQLENIANGNDLQEIANDRTKEVLELLKDLPSAEGSYRQNLWVRITSLSCYIQRDFPFWYDNTLKHTLENYEIAIMYADEFHARIECLERMYSL